MEGRGSVLLSKQKKNHVAINKKDWALVVFSRLSALSDFMNLKTNFFG